MNDPHMFMLLRYTSRHNNVANMMHFERNYSGRISIRKLFPGEINFFFQYFRDVGTYTCNRIARSLVEKNDGNFDKKSRKSVYNILETKMKSEKKIQNLYYVMYDLHER